MFPLPLTLLLSGCFLFPSPPNPLYFGWRSFLGEFFGAFNFYCSFSFDKAALKPLALQRQLPIAGVVAPLLSKFIASLKTLSCTSVCG
jgi:hypothetical protein